MQNGMLVSKQAARAGTGGKRDNTRPLLYNVLAAVPHERNTGCALGVDWSNSFKLKESQLSWLSVRKQTDNQYRALLQSA